MPQILVQNFITCCDFFGAYGKVLPKLTKVMFIQKIRQLATISFLTSTPSDVSENKWSAQQFWHCVTILFCCVFIVLVFDFAKIRKSLSKVSQKPLKSLSKASQKSFKSLSKVSQKSIKNLSKVPQKSVNSLSKVSQKFLKSCSKSLKSGAKCPP